MARRRRRRAIASIGLPVSLAGGGDPFGAVRRVLGRDPEAVLEIDVEGAGDFRVPLDAVAEVASKRVFLHWERLAPELKQAIAHATERETYPPPGEEVEMVGALPTDLDSDDASQYEAPALASPPGELPGRDASDHHGPTLLGAGPPRRGR